MKSEDLKGMTFEDGGEIDLDRDDHGFVNPDGTPLTEADLDATDTELAARTRRVRAVMGRPSLTAPGQTSPTTNARLPQPLKSALTRRAEADGVREAEVVRRALREYLHA